MDIRKLKQDADETLSSASYPPNRLVLIHSAATLVLSLVLMALSQLLSGPMNGTGGLSGMGTQAMLSTAQVVLQLVSIIVAPFWSAGLVNAALGYLRRQEVGPTSLLGGFRRWKAILSSSLLMGIHYLGLGFVAMYLSTQLFMFTPLAEPLYAVATELTTNPNADIFVLLGDSLYTLAAGYMVMFLIVYALLALPVYYRYRMVNYLIIDRPEMGGFQAIMTSRVLMRRNRMKMFKVDLSFWWFYLLEIGIGALCFGYLLPNLPLSENAAYWIFQIIAMGGQLALHYFAKPKLEITFAHCYETLLQQEPEVSTPVPQSPKKHPWTF